MEYHMNFNIDSTEGLFSSPMINISIDGHRFNVHKAIVDKYLIEVDNSNGIFADIYDYVITGSTSYKICEKIIAYLYYNKGYEINFRDIEFYIFFDKYYKNRNILERFESRKRLITTKEDLIKWMNDYTIPSDEERYNDLGGVFKKYISNVYKSCDYYRMSSYSRSGTSPSGDIIFSMYKERSNLILFLLETTNEKGYNIWDAWRDQLDATDEEIFHFGISLDDVPNKYLGKKIVQTSAP